MNLHAGELKKDYVYRCIMEMIINGEMKNNHFPSEPEFCRQLGVSRVTLRSALKRLEQEGVITRSHYYGTRITPSGRTTKKLLIVQSGFHDEWDKKIFELRMIEDACRENHVQYDICNLFYLLDPEKIAERYFGIVFFGAMIYGNEPFMDVIRKSGLPAVYCREDEKNVITDTIASVGVNMKKAWCAGFEYLSSLGFRRIATLFLKSDHAPLRLGFTVETFAEKLRKDGFTEAADMVFEVEQETLDESIREQILMLNPDAVYCYSDYCAVHVYRVLRSLGKHIPQDVSLMGFGVGSELMTPTLASVRLISPAFGVTVLRLIQNRVVTENPPPFIELPFTIFCGGSVSNVNLDGLLFISNKKQKKGRKK